MRLTYYELNFTAEFERGSIGAIILERSDAFECFLIALHKHLEKEETSFVLFEREKEMDLTKCCDFIASPFDLTFKKKAVTRNLFAELETVAGEADLSGCFCEIYGKILNVLEQLRLASDYVIGYSTDFSMQDIFKSCSVHIEEPTGTFAEKLIEYVVVMNRLLKRVFFVVANCRVYLADADYRHIQKVAEYYDLCIIFVENTQLGLPKVKKEYIIDVDLCEIH